ncbi:MAG TPA: S8 family serine peptidase [Ideonella sp.]|jgi:subtilisin family serine protease|nr:S8 family serine peptidase [Ideonella sp.]
MKCQLAGLLLCVVLPFGHAAVPQASPESAVDLGAPPPQVLLLLRLPAEHYRPDSTYAGGYGDGSSRGARRRIAASLARQHGLTLATDWPMPLLGLHCFVLNLPGGLGDQAPEQVAEALSHDARVEWAQPMNIYSTRGHDDPLYSLQPVAQAWHLTDLHRLSTGRNVRVAVIDSGVDARHPDLDGQVALGENFVDGQPFAAERHGTAVAGIIAARADNGAGIVGVAPQSRLLALRACWEQSAQATLCTALSLAMALHFAIEHDAGVINLSLSGPPDRLLDKLLDLALARRITVVGAVDRGQPRGGFPASHAGVVAVVDDVVDRAAPGALVAPGRDVPTALPGAGWNFVSGASYAAAHVTGLFALLRERGPLPMAAATIVSFTSGEIDACATLTRAAGTGSCAGSLAVSALPLARR